MNQEFKVILDYTKSFKANLIYMRLCLKTKTRKSKQGARDVSMG